MRDKLYLNFQDVSVSCRVSYRFIKKNRGGKVGGSTMAVRHHGSGVVVVVSGSSDEGPLRPFVTSPSMATRVSPYCYLLVGRSSPPKDPVMIRVA
ncbi:unnamed protein product [Lactuca saligna]|uniref:Uncharacterized protein n=1 Tax=Lactuca saligna TaxID=75948 RepID=A0AA35ZF88_LACSI|nr:unnamed protein product [Lactuca saligna]